jgi:predicted molibdopterin-dependent oxidoreductase YjgC
MATLARDLLDGKLQGLLVLGHELPISAPALSRARELDALVVIAWREVGIATAAHVALAGAAWSEVHATVTNRNGLVQRMHAASTPVGQALPAWEVVTRLAQAAGATLSYSHPKKVFEEMLSKVSAFAGADWGKPARPLQLRFAGSRG